MKEMTSVATTMMTEEEKAEVEKQMNAGNPNGTPPGIITPTAHNEAESRPTTSANGPSGSGEKYPPEGGEVASSEHHRSDKKRSKLTPEQRKKLEEMEAQRKKAMEDRVETLKKQLIERLRPFVDAKRPGERDDPETLTFEDKMRREAEDMKLESFGVEVCFSLTRTINLLMSAHFVAPAYHWIGIYDESHLVPKVEEIPRHVSSAVLWCESVR